MQLSALFPAPALGLALALVFVTSAAAAPSARAYSRGSQFSSDEARLEKSLQHLYLPIEVAPAALIGALSAHADVSAGLRSGSDLEDDAYRGYPMEEKRTTSGGMKRKMFWQPLGYMPASARVHLGNGGASENSRPSGSSKSEGSNVFRYG